MIYYYVLTEPTSHGVAGISITVPQEAELAMLPPDDTPSDASRPISVTETKYTSRASDITRTREPRLSVLAILQTCRQINLEAEHIFYASNSFHFEDATTLLGFLRTTSLPRRRELRYLHIESIVAYKVNEFDGLEEYPRRSLHPDAKKAAEILSDCQHLSIICFGLKRLEQLYVMRFLRDIFNDREMFIEYTESSDWTVMVSRQRKKCTRRSIFKPPISSNVNRDSRMWITVDLKLDVDQTIIDAKMGRPR